MCMCSMTVLSMSGAEGWSLFYLEGWCLVLFVYFGFVFCFSDKNEPGFSGLNKLSIFSFFLSLLPFKYFVLRWACLFASLIRLINSLAEILEASQAQVCPIEHHLLAPWAFRTGWLWRAQQFWRGATQLALLRCRNGRFVCREEIALEGTLCSQFCSA